jgi:hypothetical protein
MRASILAIALILVTLCNSSAASEVYWGGSGIIPDFVVIGTLTEVESEAVVCDQGEKIGPHHIVTLFDFGTVAVDTVLWSTGPISQLPVTWQSGIRHEPPVKGLSASSSASSKHEAGERRIWIAFPKRGESDCPGNSHYRFQALALDWRPTVEADVLKLFENGERLSN